MPSPEVQSFRKPVDSFDLQKEALGVAGIEMTPIDAVSMVDFISVSELPQEKRIHPQFLTDFSPVYEIADDHRVVYGVATFSPEEPSINDRAHHVIPHVPGPDTEHACLNLVRAASEGLRVTAPIEKLTMRHHVGVVPIDEPVVIELHDVKQGELAGAVKFKALGTALFFLRDGATGDCLAEALIQYRDLAPSEMGW